MARLAQIDVMDRRLCQALGAIKTEAEISKLSNASTMLEWLRKSLDDMRRQNDTLSGDELTRNQGACQTLQAFFDAFETAQTILRNN